MDVFRNAEWSVTSNGLEGIGSERGYWIDLDRITEKTKRGGFSYYDWPVHIAEKECVSMEPFLAAFISALATFSSQAGVEIDEPMLKCTLAWSRSYYRFHGRF